MSGEINFNSSDSEDLEEDLSSDDEDLSPRKLEQQKRNELRFLNELLTVLRNAYNYLDDVIKKLNLVDFANGNFPISSLINNIKSSSYQKLIDSTNGVNNNPILLHAMREEVKKFIDTDIKIDSFIENGKRVIEFKAKLIRSKNLPGFLQEVDEIHIICDTLHIDNNLPDTYRGKNLAIYSKYINIRINAIWDLSGHDGEMNDDVDGIAGESGGNCKIDTTQIINASRWTLVSNGGNGSNGQDGQDGEQGCDGETGCREEIVRNSKGESLTIVKGTEAKLGTLGGCAGVGGQKGLAGTIEIATSTKEKDEVNVKAKDGKAGLCGKPGKIGENIGRDGTDHYYVKDSFGQITCSNVGGSYKFEVAHSETERKASIYDDVHDVYVYAKRSHEMIEKRTRSADYEFFINLISVLRNAHKDFDIVLSLLNVKGYRNGLISIIDVAKNTLNLNLNIPHLNVLKKIAENVNHEDPITKIFIQKQIKAFIIPKTTTVHGNAVEVVQKIMTSADIEEYFANYDEVRVICDTFHADKNLPDSARGKNLAILANFIEVHGKVTWNLSGRGHDNVLHPKAGQNADKEGADGIDGRPGESGGSCEIKCKFFENSTSLTIISNGSNGSDGQDGGDGMDGKNGEDAVSDDFYDGPIEFEITLGNMGQRHTWGGRNDTQFKNYLSSNRSIKRKFIFVAIPIHSSWGFMLVRGSDGKKGKAGGIGGYGGKSGNAGNIQINCENGVFIENNNGRNGKSGKDGKNGVNGRDGRDAYRYSYLYGDNETFGLNSYTRYDIQKSSREPNHSVWLYGYKTYVHPVHTHTIPTSASLATKANESDIRATKSRLTGVIKIPMHISMNDIIERHVSSLSMQATPEVTAAISRYDQTLSNFKQKTVSPKSKTTTKFSISMEEIKANHSNYFVIKTNAAKTKQKEMTKKNVKVQRNVMRKQMNKNATKLFTYDEVMALITSSTGEKSCEHVFKALQNCKLNHQQCSDLCENFTEFKLQSDEYDKEEFNDTIEDFVAIHASSIMDDFEYLTEHWTDNVYKFLMSNEASFLLHHFGLLPYTTTSLLKLIKEKFLLLHFEQIYEKISSKTDRKIDCSIKLTEFLYDTRKFESNIEEVNTYFIDDGKNERKFVKNYLLKCIKENSACELLKKIQLELQNNPEDAEEIQELLENSKENILAFYENEKIVKFLTKNITEIGIKSPLYRMILSAAFNINIMLYVKNINDNFCLIEEHHNESHNEELHVLLSNAKFTLLTYDEKKIEKYQRQKFVNETIEKYFKNINGKMNETEGESSEIWKFLNSNDYKFGNIFQLCQSSLDYDEIKEILLTFFSNQAQNSLYQMDIIEHRLFQIYSIDGYSILTAFATRFYTEGFQISLNDFQMLLKHILYMTLESNNNVTSIFTFMLLGNKQSDWMIEIVLKQVESKVKTDLIVKWRKQLKNTKIKEIIPLLAEKMSELNENEANEENFIGIFANMKYFKDTDYETLKVIDLIKWNSIITEGYLEERVLTLKVTDSNTVVRILDEIQSKYGQSSVKQLLNIFSMKGIGNINLISMLEKFNDGLWTLGENVFNILKSYDSSEWMEVLDSQFMIDKEQRSVRQIINCIDGDNDTSKSIKETLELIEMQANEVFIIENDAEKRIIDFDEWEIMEWLSNVKDHTPESLVEALAVVLAAIRLKTDVLLRNTQIIAILTMWNDSQNGVLVQISTGEGKTLIGVAFAVLKVIYNQKVDTGGK